MNRTVEKLLQEKADNHMLPFFWQHGEDEETLRHYMDVIQKANCHAVCVESRPHPDFCGEKWWQDMDVILDEARRRNMKVWILDDSHFPTGYANGAAMDREEILGKHSIFLKQKVLPEQGGTVTLDLREAGMLTADQSRFDPPMRIFHDDRILFAAARKEDGETLDLTSCLSGEVLSWEKPEGNWTLLVGVCSGNVGSRRNYINVTQKESVRLLLDAVYEPHWQHYAADFGKTIAGFFSDEPELGNFYTYAKNNPLGTDQDLPWGTELEPLLREALGENWRADLTLLWLEGKEAPRVRSIYMDILTKLVRENFSCQLGVWCRSHGVQYIGHIIEDDGQHCRTACSLGHYFRGLQGQDMSGIDNIGGQVLPQGEDDATPYFLGGEPRKGEFYHYGLAKLAQSAAAIEERKRGNSMCEIFGNYGWSEGVRLEKYMADHFLVRGINQFVPHAFSGKAFPDPDCPPHFYAHGHNPQYRHFGQICGYMNRVATLTSSGKHEVPAAVLYHAEAEWADSDAMPFEKPLRALYDRQIDCHVLPADLFEEREYYNVRMEKTLEVNGQIYHVLVVPETRVLPQGAVKGLQELAEKGMQVLFVNRHPAMVAETGEALPEILKALPAVALSELGPLVEGMRLSVPRVEPANDRIRILHIKGDTPVFFLVNEAVEAFTGTITFPAEGGCFLYDPWFNVCRPADVRPGSGETRVSLTLEPLKSVAVVFGSCDAAMEILPQCDGEGEELRSWNRSRCAGIDYPRFENEERVEIPEDLAAAYPEFSGYVRYETPVTGREEEQAVLSISDAAEAVEVFVNGRSLGIQIAPPFVYDLSGVLTEGENLLAIEVATTLERQCFLLLDDYGRQVTKPPRSQSGLTGTVTLYRRAAD